MNNDHGSALEVLAAALEPFAKKAARYDLAHSSGYDYVPHDNDDITHRLGDFRNARQVLDDVQVMLERKSGE